MWIIMFYFQKVESRYSIGTNFEIGFTLLERFIKNLEI